jgi:hypothetical protein
MKSITQAICFLLVFAAAGMAQSYSGRVQNANTLIFSHSIGSNAYTLSCVQTSTTTAVTWSYANITGSSVRLGFDKAQPDTTCTITQVNGSPGADVVVPSDTSSTSNQFLNGYNAINGLFSKAQPSFSNLSGSPTITQLNGAFSGTCDNTTFHRADGTCAAVSGGGGTWGSITGTLSSQTDLNTALSSKAPLASPTFTGTVSGITKAMVGLGNVPNTDATSRANHTGTQLASTISDFTTAAQAATVSSYLSASTVLPVNTTATSNQFFTAYDSSTGAFTKVQPSFGSLSGSPTITQLNGAFTGTCDATTYHRGDGSCVTPSAGGGGTAVSGVLDFGSIADGACASLTFTATGATTTNTISPGWPATLETGLFGSMLVSAVDTIQVRLCNLSGTSVNPASQTFRARYF